MYFELKMVFDWRSSLSLRDCLSFSTHLEKSCRWTWFHTAVFDFSLLCQVIRWLDGWLHPLDCQESSQVGCVRWYHDQSKEPPHPCHHPSRYGPVEIDNASSLKVKISFIFFALIFCQITLVTGRFLAALGTRWWTTWSWPDWTRWPRPLALRHKDEGCPTHKGWIWQVKDHVVWC